MDKKNLGSICIQARSAFLVLRYLKSYLEKLLRKDNKKVK